MGLAKSVMTSWNFISLTVSGPGNLKINTGWKVMEN